MAKTHPSEVFRLAPCLTSDELLVLLALADYGARIFPSQAALAAKTRLHRTTVNRALQSLRKKEVVRAKGFGKALTYMLDLSQGATPTCSGERQVVSLPATGGVAGSDRDPNYRTNHQPNQGAADAAAGGVDISWDLRSRISMRDHRADVDRNVATLAKRMMADGCPPTEVKGWIEALCGNWARTGEDAYTEYKQRAANVENARDKWAVIRHRLKGVAA
jgi:biotin operon repressor